MCGGGGGGRGGAHACLFPSVLRLDSLSMHCIYVAVATRSSGI